MRQHREFGAQVAAVMAHYILLRNPALAAYDVAFTRFRRVAD